MRPAFSFIDEKGPHTADEIVAEVEALSKKLSAENSVIVIESERSLQTAIRFQSCLLRGRVPFMLPSEEFRREEFLAYVTASLGAVSLWPMGSDLPSPSAGVVRSEIAKAKRGFIVKTSGTSGLKNKFVLHEAELFIEKFTRRRPSFEKTLNFFPPDSIAGVELLIEASVHGKCIVNPGSLGPAEIVKLIVREKIDFLHVTPTFLNLLLVSGRLSAEHLSSVKALAYGSEPAQKSVLEKVRAMNPKMELVQIYGMSEIGLQKTLPVTATPDMFRLDETVNSYRVREGQLEVKSESPMVCYLNNGRSVESEWFATGDVVEEKDGLLKVIGRSDDVMNVAGKKFHPIQLEELLMGMPGVDDVMVTAEPHELIGQSVTAHISTRSEEKEFRSNLREYLEKNVPSWMRPQRVLLSPSAVSSRLKKRRKTSI